MRDDPIEEAALLGIYEELQFPEELRTPMTDKVVMKSGAYHRRLLRGRVAVLGALVRKAFRRA